MDLLERTPAPFFTDEHNAFRDTLRRFVDTEIEPFVSEWDEAGTFPRELYKKASGTMRKNRNTCQKSSLTT